MAMQASALDAPLLQLTRHDPFTLRDAVQGVCVTGGIGSGKTSGSGATLAGAYLPAGMGGLPSGSPVLRAVDMASGTMRR